MTTPGLDCAAIPSPAGPPVPEEAAADEPPLPVLTRLPFVDARVLPWGHLVWAACGRTRVEVMDTTTSRVVRSLLIAPAEVRPVPGLREPRVVALRRGGSWLAVYDARGVPVIPERPMPAAALADGVAAAPGGEGLFVLTLEGLDSAGEAAGLGWIEVPLHPEAEIDPPRPLAGTSGARPRAAATDAAAGLTFVLLDTPAGACELLAFARDGAQGAIALRWRAPTPLRTLLTQEGDGGPVAAIVAREDRFDAARLGPTPPALGDDEPAEPGQIPWECLVACYPRCERPSGKLGKMVQTLLQGIERDTPQQRAQRVQRLKEGLDADQLAAASVALCAPGMELLAWQLTELGWKRHPQHPHLCLLQAGALARARRWRQAKALLAPVDPGALDPASARHLHHLRATTLLHLGEREEALSALEQAERCEGACALGWLVALATPLEEERAWTPEQAALRELARAVAEADVCLARGDAPGAAQALDRRVVWEARELQSLARLAEAHLLVDGDGPAGRLRKALALATFEHAHASRALIARREAPLPAEKWLTARLDALAHRAHAWLNETLGGALTKVDIGLE